MTKATGGSDEGSKHRARLEANPLDWNDLTEDQKRAAEQACEILGDIACQPWSASRAGDPKARALGLFLPRVDEQRRNHAILIDGGRGSGKTAVLMTLLRAWTSQVQGSPRKEPDAPWTKTVHVVPVGLVDLQPLPDEANLLLHLVGLLHPVVEAIEGDTGSGAQGDRAGRRRDVAPCFALDEEELPVKAAWRRFLEAAAAGWDADVRARRGKLDPEAYALEVEQTSRKRLDVVRSFRELGDALVEAYMEWRWPQKDEAPLFVLAIDDADMNPKRARELLDLVRTLWHPRFAFVLTGDTRLFVEVLRKDIGYKAGKMRGELAQDVYDKAIPPGHRCVLRELSPMARFRLLSATLARLPAPPHPWLALSSLADYLALQGQLLASFPVKLRALKDFELHAAQLPPDRPESSAAVLAAMAGGQDGAKTWPESSGALFALRFATDELETWRPEPATTVLLRVDEGLEFVYEHTFSVAPAGLGATDWDGGLRGSPRGGLGLRGFLLSVTVSERDERVRIAWPLPDFDRPLDYAVLSCLLNRACGLPAPQGEQSTFELHRMLSASVENAAGMAQLARRFVHVVVTLGETVDGCYRGRKRLPSAQLDEMFKKPEDAPSWAQLAQRCAQLHAKGTLPAAPFVEWVVGRAGLLAAPESGLAAADANAWIDALRDAFGALDPSEWARVSARLVEERLGRVRRSRVRDSADLFVAPEQRVVEFVDSMDARHPDHHFADEVGKTRAGLRHSLYDALRRTPIASAPTPRVHPAGGLAFYLSGKQIEALSAVRLPTLRAWVTQMDGFQGVTGAAEFVMTAMFRVAAEMGDVPSELLSMRADVRALREYISRTVRTPVLPWQLSTDGDRKAIGPRLAIAPGRCDWGGDVPFRGSVLGALLALAWNLAADIEDSSGDGAEASSLVSPWWQAVSGLVEGSRLPNGLPWPGVQWPALVEHRLLAEAWNDRVVPVAVQAAGIFAQDSRVADAVAQWYVAANVSLFRDRTAAVELDLNAPVARWSSLLRSEAVPGGRRAAAFMDWWRRIGLLAAPESGLSARAANAILELLGRNDGMVLRQARFERLAFVGVEGRGEQIALIDAFDAASPEHQWRNELGVVASPDKAALALAGLESINRILDELTRPGKPGTASPPVRAAPASLPTEEAPDPAPNPGPAPTPKRRRAPKKPRP